MDFPSKILAIKWVDAKSRDDWHSKEEALVDSLVDHEVISVGSIMTEDKNYLVLLQSDSHDGKVSGWISIPKRWILEQKSYGQEDVST